MKRFCTLVVALWLGATVFAARAGDVLTVDSLNGSASLDRLGQRSELKAGDQINERDLIHVGEGGSVSLNFAGHGFVELGPGADLGIEKLPFASYADDLQTIFSLTRGYLRLVWRPAPDANWPVFVYFGSQHAGVVPGEYFFDARPGEARACVAAGHLSVLANAGGSMQKLHPSACYRFAAGLPPERQPREIDGWISVRRSFNLDAPNSPEAMLAQSDERDDGPALAPVPPLAQPAAQAPPHAAEVPAPLPLPPPPVASAAPPPVPAPRPPVAPLAAPVNPPPAANVASAAPAAVPATAATAEPPGGQGAGSGAWGINVASYPAVDDANKSAQQLRDAGYAASVQPAQVKGQTWYRVRLQGYGSVDAAHSAAVQLQSRFGYAGLWITRAGPAPGP